MAERRVALVAHWDWVLHNFRLPLARRLRARGLDVALVCPPGAYVPRLRAAGFEWLPWPVSRRGMNPAREALSILRLARLYRRQRFAAVQHFTIKPVLYGSLAARLAGVPAVIGTFTGLGFLFSGHPTARRLRPFVLPVLRGVLRSPRVHVVFQNAGDRDRFLRLGLALADRTTVIAGSGVDTECFTPLPPAAATRRGIVVLMAARLLWDKGVGEFVEAARLLRARGVAAEFWVAGDADPGNPGCVARETLDGWKREGVVEFLGHREDMPDLLRQVAIAALPSHHEGVPRFLLEAAAAALPIVASDIEGARAVVRPGVNGLLVPAKDAGALAAAIRRLVEDVDGRGRMGQASREIAVTEFAEARILDGYEAMYRRLGILS